MEKRTKKEIENRKLFELIMGNIKEIHRNLLYLCISREGDMLNKGTANVICGLRMNLFHLEDIIRDLLFEEEKPGTILKERGRFPDIVHLH